MMSHKNSQSVTVGTCLVLIALAAMGCATSESGPRLMTDASGMTVYIFDNDPRGGTRSDCAGSCGRQWPPVPAPAEAPSSDFGVVMREDGSRQLSYRGRPLYRYWKDEKPGDMRGDRFLGLWHIVPLGGYYYNPYELPWRRFGC